MNSGEIRSSQRRLSFLIMNHYNNKKIFFILMAFFYVYQNGNFITIPFKFVQAWLEIEEKAKTQLVEDFGAKTNSILAKYLYE